MTKSIETIMKDIPLDESTKTALIKLWDENLTEARQVIMAEERTRLTESFDVAVSDLEEATMTYLRGRLTPHVAELHETIKATETRKTELEAEVADLKEGVQDEMKRRFVLIESYLREQVYKEVNQMHASVKSHRKAVMETINANNAATARLKENLKVKGAKILEYVLDQKVQSELEDLREDIEAARKADFGREIFESFAQMYHSNFFNSSKEFASILESKKAAESEATRVKGVARKALTEAKTKIKEANAAAKSATAKARELTEAKAHSEKMNEYLQHVTGETRAHMKSLLEATSIDRMDKVFQRAMKSNSAKPKTLELVESKKTTSELVVQTGNVRTPEDDQNEVVDDFTTRVQRLSGVEK